MSDQENRLHLGNLGPLDVALLKQVATEAAEASTRKWLTIMGLDPNHPIQSQAAFAALREMSGKATDPELAADRVWTRRTRLRFEGAFGRVVAAALTISVVGAAHAAYAGILAMFGAGVPPRIP